MPWNFNGHATCWNARNKSYVVDERTKKNKEKYGVVTASTSEYNAETKSRKTDSIINLYFFGEQYEQLKKYKLYEKDIIFVEQGIFKNVYNLNTRQTNYFFVVKSFYFPDYGADEKTHIPKEPEIAGNEAEEYLGTLPF